MAILTPLPLLALASATASSTAVYTNPVLDRDFPDPAVVRLPDGTFVAFATGGSSDHIQCASSPDLVTWTVLSDALPKLPSWACQDCHRSCAPDVQRHGSLYFMYFSAYAASNVPAARRRNCIGVATSLKATGPYVAEPAPILCDGEYGTAMDPRTYDHDDGTVWLYYGSHHDPINVVQLDPSRLSLAPGAQPRPAVLPDASSYGSVVEAPWVYRDAVGRLSLLYSASQAAQVAHHPGHNPEQVGCFTMLYSGSQCCGVRAHYAVMAARSISGHPLGPWEKLGGPSGTHSVLLASDPAGAFVSAPGHNAVVRDDDGVDWMLYHANDGGQCERCDSARTQATLGRPHSPSPHPGAIRATVHASSTSIGSTTMRALTGRRRGLGWQRHRTHRAPLRWSTPRLRGCGSQRSRTHCLGLQRSLA